MIITDIKKDTKYKDKVLISAGGKDYLLNKDVFLEHCLYAGMDIAPKDIKALCEQSDKREAFSAALNYISRKKCSKKMMSDYLAKKGFNRNITDYTLQKLMDYKYIDDREYAKSYIFYSKDKGRLKIAYELKLRGIDEDIINEFNKTTEQDAEQCIEAGKKHIKGKDKNDKKLRQKLYRYLANKGFEYDSVISAVHALLPDGDEF